MKTLASNSLCNVSLSTGFAVSWLFFAFINDRTNRFRFFCSIEKKLETNRQNEKIKKNCSFLCVRSSDRSEQIVNLKPCNLRKTFIHRSNRNAKNTHSRRISSFRRRVDINCRIRDNELILEFNLPLGKESGKTTT